MEYEVLSARVGMRLAIPGITLASHMNYYNEVSGMTHPKRKPQLLLLLPDLHKA